LAQYASFYAYKKCAVIRVFFNQKPRITHCNSRFFVFK
jgi:hypothetical protein